MNQNFVIKHQQSNTYVKDLIGYDVIEKDIDGNDMYVRYVKPNVTRNITDAKFFNDSSEAINWCKKIKEKMYINGNVMNNTFEVIMVTHIPTGPLKEEVREEFTWFSLEV